MAIGRQVVRGFFNCVPIQIAVEQLDQASESTEPQTTTTGAPSIAAIVTSVTGKVRAKV
jgi:hypothetical protein